MIEIKVLILGAKEECPLANRAEAHIILQKMGPDKIKVVKNRRGPTSCVILTLPKEWASLPEIETFDKCNALFGGHGEEKHEG